MTRCVDVVLSIPDNEARTALATLQRLGVAAGGLERADLYRFEVDSRTAGELIDVLSRIETIYNPNKHVLRVRDAAVPAAGEVWIDESAPPRGASEGAVRIAGRVLPGVTRYERCTAWRVLDAHGLPASAELVAEATAMLLCNPAFQRARTQ
jgi:hypothetical protein